MTRDTTKPSPVRARVRRHLARLVGSAAFKGAALGGLAAGGLACDPVPPPLVCPPEAPFWSAYAPLAAFACEPEGSLCFELRLEDARDQLSFGTPEVTGGTFTSLEYRLGTLTVVVVPETDGSLERVLVPFDCMGAPAALAFEPREDGSWKVVYPAE